MLHALTKQIEEDYFADNMSAFIALAPILIETHVQPNYKKFIAEDWQLLKHFPSVLDENFWLGQ